MLHMLLTFFTILGLARLFSTRKLLLDTMFSLSLLLFNDAYFFSSVRYMKGFYWLHPTSRVLVFYCCTVSWLSLENIIIRF